MKEIRDKNHELICDACGRVFDVRFMKYEESFGYIECKECKDFKDGTNWIPGDGIYG